MTFQEFQTICAATQSLLWEDFMDDYSMLSADSSTPEEWFNETKQMWLELLMPIDLITDNSVSCDEDVWFEQDFVG